MKLHLSQLISTTFLYTVQFQRLLEPDDGDEECIEAGGEELFCAGEGLQDALKAVYHDITLGQAKNSSKMIADFYAEVTMDTFSMPLPSGSSALMLEKPTGGMWLTLWQDVSPGSGGTGIMFGAGILLLVAGTYGRSLSKMFGVGDAYSSRQAKQKFWTGFVAILVWYWAVLILLFLVNGVTTVIMPDLSKLSGDLQAMVHPDNLIFSTYNVTQLATWFSIGALGVMALEVLFYIREWIIFALIYVGPIGIATIYSGIPVVEDYAKAGLRRLVPLAMLPIPAAIVFRGMQFWVDHAYPGGGASSASLRMQLMVGGAPILALFFCWKSFKMTNPVIGGLMEKTTKGTASLGLDAVSLGGRVPIAAGAKKMLDDGTGAAVIAGGIKGGARHQARKAAYGGSNDGRRQDPDPSGSSSDDDPPDAWRDEQDVDWDRFVDEIGSSGSAGATEAQAASADSTSAGGSLGGAGMDQSQLPPGGSTVDRAGPDSSADYVQHGDSHFDGPAERPSGTPDPSGLPPNRVDGQTHSERRLADYDEPEHRQPGSGVSSGDPAAGAGGGPRYASRRHEVYYDEDHGLRKGPRSRGQGGRRPGTTGSGVGGAGSTGGQSSTRRKAEIRRLVREQLRKQDQGGRDVVDVDVRVEDAENGRDDAQRGNGE